MQPKKHFVGPNRGSLMLLTKTFKGTSLVQWLPVQCDGKSPSGSESVGGDRLSL